MSIGARLANRLDAMADAIVERDHVRMSEVVTLIGELRDCYDRGADAIERTDAAIDRILAVITSGGGVR